MPKEQITITLDAYNLKALRILADKTFEGNVSMALRSFFTHNKLGDIIKHIEDDHGPENHWDNCKYCTIGGA